MSRSVSVPALPDIATPAAPATGFRKLYFKADGGLYSLSSAAVEARLTLPAGGVVGQYLRGDATWQTLNKVHPASDTPPSNPQEGDYWVDTDEAVNPGTVAGSHVHHHLPGPVYLGEADTDVVYQQGMTFETDQRGYVLNYDTNGDLTGITESAGTTDMKSTTMTYNDDGTLATVTETVGAQTSTTTMVYTTGVLTGVTRSLA